MEYLCTDMDCVKYWWWEDWGRWSYPVLTMVLLHVKIWTKNPLQSILLLLCMCICYMSLYMCICIYCTAHPHLCCPAFTGPSEKHLKYFHKLVCNIRFSYPQKSYFFNPRIYFSSKFCFYFVLNSTQNKKAVLKSWYGMEPISSG